MKTRNAVNPASCNSVPMSGRVDPRLVAVAVIALHLFNLRRAEEAIGHKDQHQHQY